MTTSEIILRWIMENREYCNNYLNDFLCLYLSNSNIVLSCPSHNNGLHNVYMIPKNELFRRIYKYSNCDELYYDNHLSMDEHNPYHDAARYLFKASHNEEDYLRLWLFLLLREYEKKDFLYFGIYKSDFFNVNLELSNYFYKNDYNFLFGNAYYMLPTMQHKYFLYKLDKSIDFYLYELQSQMNYVKATNFMILINEKL